MNAAVIIVVLTTLLIHCGHCQQRVTFSALQDAPKTLHSLNVRSISNRQSPGCMQDDFDNILTQECGFASAQINLVQINSPSALNQYRAGICQQRCYDPLYALFTRCNGLQGGTDLLRDLCTGYNAGTPNAGSSAEAPTFFKALFLLAFIVMAMLLL